jgi:hypothetical protein
MDLPSFIFDTQGGEGFGVGGDPPGATVIFYVFSLTPKKVPFGMMRASPDTSTVGMHTRNLTPAQLRWRMGTLW